MCEDRTDGGEALESGADSVSVKRQVQRDGKGCVFAAVGAQRPKCPLWVAVKEALPGGRVGSL